MWIMNLGEIIFCNTYNWLKIRMHLNINKIKSKHPVWQTDEATVETIHKGFINT